MTDDLQDPGPEEPPPLARQKPAFTQDPHRVRELAERSLEGAIGREVRQFRRAQGMTVADLAQATGLSIGMLSKIENGQTSPSLTTLQALLTDSIDLYNATRQAHWNLKGTNFIGLH